MTDWTVQADKGAVRVSRNADTITVTWFCGATRRFTPDDLRQAIANLDRVRSHTDVWLSTADSQAREFAARVVDGEFYASEGPTSGGDHVPWDELHDALRKALRKPRRGA